MTTTNLAQQATDYSEFMFEAMLHQLSNITQKLPLLMPALASPTASG